MPLSLTTSLRGLLLLPALVLLAACSSTPPVPTIDYKPDYDFSKVHTLAFFHRSGMVTGNNPVPLSDMERDRIDTALETALRKRGYEVLVQDDATSAQLLISWTLVLNDKTDVRTYQNPGMGVGYSRFGGYNGYSMYNCWGCGGTDVSVQNYTEGTFIVDLIDPKLKRSVWRGEIQSRLKGQMKKDQTRYNAVADHVLASFPPPVAGAAPSPAQ